MPSEKKRRVTQNDVARHAQVSNAVVSYVINGGPRPTSEEVRRRVFKAIDELGYQLDATARGLRSRRTHTIGFIHQDVDPSAAFTSAFSAQVLTGIAMELKRRGYYLTIYLLASDEPLSEIRELVHSNRLDGMLVRLMQDPPASDALVELLSSARLPLVCIERAGAARFEAPTVRVDDVYGGYLATSYLLRQGHRRIAHLHGNPAYGAALDRFSGYRRALAECDLPVDESLIGAYSWQSADGAAALQQLLASAAPPTAIFAANDALAYGALNAAQARGLSVPGDIAIVGYDDDHLATQSNPALTTVRLPSLELGRRAAALLLAELADSAPEPDLLDLVPVELIRRSTA